MKMKNRPVLAVLLFLALPLALARRAPSAPPGPALGMPVSEPLPWSARGSPGAAAAAAAAALDLLREEGAGPPAAPQKRDMHDFFVGLMGKRAAEPGRAAGRGGDGPAPRCSPGPPAPGEAPLRAA
ncbi:tachykinin-3 [Anomalospiza imberbis]|uniref:tachykinin-3 n=1 Tax=Anomalospiza imberbis TaxID=187417 RepID=UPI00358F770D